MNNGAAGDNVDNILRVWDMADAIDFSEDMIAYYRYRSTLDRIAQHYHISLASVVGMFCSLSPNQAYMTNLRAVISILHGDRGAGYSACRERALRCMRGENFLDFTRGLKTRNFYSNIMDPGDPAPITIDGHAYSIYAGKYYRMKDAVRLRYPYSVVADAYREASAVIGHGVLPNQLQAVTWFTWKRIHRVVFNSQLHLYRAIANDQWMLDLLPDDIKPFVRQEKTISCPSTRTESPSIKRDTPGASQAHYATSLFTESLPPL